jgi:hypothetical protein
MRYSSNTLSRRYELPTCLLEVRTERSPLSEWQSQIVAQNLHFRLQLANGKKIIKGNQQQITNLIEAVTIYCDRWLAQDDFDSLDHAIAVPKLSKIKLSTLQLFDLYESLELCANEFVILPNLVLEVRRLSPNWLKVMAGAITIVGISIGTVRLIFREQPSYQIASTPAASSPDKASIPPLASLEDKSASNNTKIAPPPKSANQPTPSIADARPNPSVSIPPRSAQDPNREAKIRGRMDKVAIAPEPSNNPIGNSSTGNNSTGNNSTGNTSSDRLRASDNPPSISDGVTANSSPIPRQSTRLESPTKDAPQSPTVTAESSKPSPAAASRSANVDNAITNNIKVIQIQSELPSYITTALVGYIQTKSITTTTTGTIALNLEMSGDRIRKISTNNEGSTLKDSNAITELESIILKWRSANPVTGKIYIVLQL